MIGKESKADYFSVDPNLIHIVKEQSDCCDYAFEGKVDECMGITDHFKLFVSVKESQFFIKIPKRDYESCLSKSKQSVTIGFNEKDVAYL